MKYIQIIMPEVKECSAKSCGFNKDSNCSARAITVGDNKTPGCGTFFAVPKSETASKSADRPSGVSACKIADCKFNNDYECVAEGVVIAVNNDKANCQTYAHR